MALVVELRSIKHVYTQVNCGPDRINGITLFLYRR